MDFEDYNEVDNIEDTNSGGLDDIEFGQGELAVSNEEVLATSKSLRRQTLTLAKNNERNHREAVQAISGDISGKVSVRQGKSKKRLLKRAIKDLERSARAAEENFDGEPNGITPVDLQLHRIQSMGVNVQLRVARALMGGTLSNSELDTRLAVERFESTTGVPASEIVKRLNITPDQIPSEITTTYYDESGQAKHSYVNKYTPTNTKDDAIALSMLGKTADSYAEFGSVHGQANVYHTMEQEEKANDDLSRAMNFANKAASMAMMEVTGSESFKKARHQQFVEGIYKEALDGRDHRSDFVMLPNDFGIMGAIPTMSYSPNYTEKNEVGDVIFSGQRGTPFNTRQFSEIKDTFKTEEEMWRYMGSGKNTYFPMPSRTSLEEEHGASYAQRLIDINDDKYRDFQDEWKHLRKTMNTQMPNLAAEASGEGRWTGLTPVSDAMQLQDNGDSTLVATEESMTGQFYDEASVLGLSRHGEDFLGGNSISTLGGVVLADNEGGQSLSVSPRSLRQSQLDSAFGANAESKGMHSKAPAGLRATGSMSGGIYGEKALSQVQEFVELRRSGSSELDAYESVMEFYNHKVGTADKITAVSTERSKYLEDMSNMAAPRQGTKEWLAQRAGSITGSIISKVGGPAGRNRLAYNIASESLALEADRELPKWRGDAWTSAGNTNEPKVLENFLNRNKGIGQEEVGFMQNPNYENFGASPDGILFDTESGDKLGLLELKALKDTRLDSALQTYYNQMQWQMFNAGEDTTVFYAMATDSDRVVQEVVHADPDVQAMLVDKALETLRIANLAQGTEELIELRDIINTKSPAAAGSKFEPKLGVSSMHKQGQQMSYMETNSLSSYTDKEDIVGPYRANLRMSDLGVSQKNDALMKLMEGEKLSEVASYRLKGMNEVHGEAKAENKDRDTKARSQALMQMQAEKMMSDDLIAAKKEEAEASKEVTENFKAIGSKAIMAGKALANLAGQGTGTALDLEERAVAAGMSPDELRGVENLLMEGGASREGAKVMTTQATKLQQTFASADKTAKWVGDVQVKIAQLNAKGHNIPIDVLPTYKDAPRNTKDVINTVMRMTEFLTPEDKGVFLNAIDMSPKFATNRAEYSSISNALDRSVDIDGAHATRSSEATVEVESRRVEEFLGSAGETAGFWQGIINKASEGASGIITATALSTKRALDYGSEFGLQGAVRGIVNSEGQGSINPNVIPTPRIDPTTGFPDTNPTGTSAVNVKVNVKNNLTIEEGAITSVTTDDAGGYSMERNPLDTGGGTE